MTERFPLQTQFEDRWVAVAFIVQLMMTLLSAVSSMGRIREEIANGLQQYDGMVMSLLLCAFWGVVLSIAWLYTMSRMAQMFVLVSNVTQVALCLITSTLLLSKGHALAGFTVMALGALNGLWLFMVRDRVTFAGLLLEHCCRVVSMYSGVAMLAVSTLLVQMVYIVLFASIAQDMYTLGMTFWLLVLFLLFFWTSQVLQNVVYTTVSGVMATWYFMHTHQMDDPTVPCLKRALSTSFGSVCLGSLGIFWVKVAEILARSGTGGSQLLAALQQRLQDSVDQAMQYFNSYALVHSALYGKPFVYAAMDTVHLIRQCGLGTLVRDSLIHPLLLMTSIVGGCIIGSLVSMATMEVPTFLCSWLVAAAAIGITTSVVNSAVISVFVCFAEEPDTLRLTNPDLHHHISHVLAGLNEDEL
eukprot:GGOE01014630.1.p1 GENE.GGOE01014630.1~~GGOE01014630.1.p1  ORF type:complete len:482 (+),score=180.33 GGOE01014630.1:207-1448(+)